MMQRPWAPGTIDEWLPRNLRLCWGGAGDSGGSGFGGDSGGGFGGASTGGGDWGSSGSYDASGMSASGDLGAWAGSAYDASTAGTGMGGGGDWGSFGDTSYGSFNAPNAIFTDVAGPNPGVTTGGGDWGSAGMFSAAGTGGGPGGAMFGADLGAGAGAPGQLSGGGLFGDYGGGGNLSGGQVGSFYGGSNYGGGSLFGGQGGGSPYGGGGGSYGGGGGGRSGGGGFGGFGSAGTSSGGRSGGPLGASNAVAAAPTASRGQTYADTVGGGSLTGQTSGRTSDAPTRSEAEVESAGPDVDSGRADADAEFGAPSAPEAEAGPSLSDAAPAGDIGGSRDAAPASAGQGSLPSTSNFGPQSVVGPSQSYNEAAQTLSGLTQSALSGYDYQGSPYADMGPQGAGQAPVSFDSRFGDWGPQQQQTAPDFNQAFQAFEAQPGWNPAEQTAGVTGLAEPTAWAANPYAPSTDVSVGRDFNQAFDPFADIPTGMDLAGDQRSEAEPSLTFNEMWGDTPYSTLPSDQLSRSAQETLENDFGYFPNPGYVQGPPAQTWSDRANANMNWIADRAASVTMYPFTKALDAFMAVPNPLPPGTMDPATAFSNFAQNTLLGGSNIQSLNPDAIAPFELGQQGRAGANPDLTDWGSVFEGAAPTEARSGIVEAFIPGGRTTDFEYGAPPTPAPIDVEVVRSDDPSVPADPRGDPATPATPGTLPPAVETPESGRPGETPASRPAETPESGWPAETVPGRPGETPASRPGEAQPTSPPGLVTMLPPPALTPPAQPTNVPPQQPPPQPGEPGEPDYDEEGEGEGEPSVPAQPGRPLGAPTTGTQNTPVTTARVRQEQQGATRNRPVNEALHGILTRAAEHAGVIVRIGSGGQIDTRSRADYKKSGGWTGSIRHNHGNAADVRLEHNGRLLDYNNPQDRVVMEAFVREAARLGATGMGAGMRYMGPNTIHVGFGTSRFWKADNPGSRALQQAWAEGRQGPANRPPADIPGRPTQQAGVPLPRRRPEDTVQPNVPPAAATPPADIPPPAPPVTALPPADRPPADIPAPAPKGPNEFDIPVTPPVRNATVIANNILKQATAHLNKDSGQAAFQAASVVAAKAMAAAGIPANLARSLMTKGALDGAIANGYGPGGPNSTVMGFSIWGKVQSTIADGVNSALQGYQPARPGEVLGPPAPAVPGKQSAAPFGQQYAGLSQSRGPASGEDYGREGDVGAASPYFGGTVPTVPQLSPLLTPPAPAPSWGRPPAIQPAPPPMYTPTTPGMFSPFRGNEAALPPEGQQASLLSFLQNFNPISTAEARGGRSQPANLKAPQADPGTIQGRLSSQRSNVISDLQTNQGLRNTLDLIATGEVGSQGKAAVLGFLETTMNRVAAEASREGRAPTGRDLLNYLNDRSYFPDTWGKIESGKIKGGALTDDLLSDVGAGSNTTKGSTGNSSATSPGSRFGGNPTNVTIGREHYGVENYGHHAAWYNALGALQDMPAVGFMPPMPPPAPTELRGLAKGGHVDDDEPVVVGEEGPEVFVPDQSGTVVPHMPQPGQSERNIDRWPKVPAVGYPGQYGGVEREIRRRMRSAQDPVPGLMDMIDREQLRLNAANWHRMINDPSLIALGRSRIEDRR